MTLSNDDLNFFAMLQEQHPDGAHVIHEFAAGLGANLPPDRFPPIAQQKAKEASHTHLPPSPYDTLHTPSQTLDDTDPAFTDNTWRHHPALASRLFRKERFSPAKGREQKSPLMAEVIARRRELGMTQQAFADRLGVSVRTYQEWEQGRRQPSGPAAAMLRRTL